MGIGFFQRFTNQFVHFSEGSAVLFLAQLPHSRSFLDDGMVEDNCVMIINVNGVCALIFCTDTGKPVGLVG